MKQLEGIPDDVVCRVLQAARDAGIEFTVYDRRFIDHGSQSVTVQQAAAYLLNEHEFWMDFHDAKPERYYPWRKHIDRLEGDSVPCLGKTATGRPCGNMVFAALNPKVYDPAVHDYCRHHGDQCPV